MTSRNLSYKRYKTTCVPRWEAVEHLQSFHSSFVAGLCILAPLTPPFTVLSGCVTQII